MCVAFASSKPRAMLAPWVKKSYESRLGMTSGIRGVSILAQGPSSTGMGERATHAALLRTDLATFAANHMLAEEIFGPAAIIVEADSWSDFQSLRLRGSLTLSIYGEQVDSTDFARARGIVESHGTSPAASSGTASPPASASANPWSMAAPAPPPIAPIPPQPARGRSSGGAARSAGRTGRANSREPPMC